MSRWPQRTQRTAPWSPELIEWLEADVTNSREYPNAEVCFSRPPSTPLQALMEAPPGVEPEESSMERLERIAEQAKEATAALASLPEPQREAFTLHYIEGHSHAEVGAILGVSKATAHRHCQEAKAALVAMLTPDEPEPEEDQQEPM